MKPWRWRAGRVPASFSVLLPDLGGLEISRELRDEFGNELPIVFISGPHQAQTDRQGACDQPEDSGKPHPARARQTGRSQPRSGNRDRLQKGIRPHSLGDQRRTGSARGLSTHRADRLVVRLVRPERSERSTSVTRKVAPETTACLTPSVRGRHLDQPTSGQPVPPAPSTGSRVRRVFTALAQGQRPAGREGRRQRPDLGVHVGSGAARPDD
jgi:hypothetical protein